MTLAAPHYLYLLLVIPAALGFFWFRERRKNKSWLTLVAPRLRSQLVAARPNATRWLSQAFFLVAFALVVLALAQPEGEPTYAERRSEARNLMFLLDVSRSMTAEDVAPNRLIAAKIAAQEILDSFQDDRAGLVVFAGQHYVQVPLTTDHNYLRQAIQQANPSDIPVGGSDLAGALQAAIERLEKNGADDNVLVILSDGEEHTRGLSTAAAEAREAGLIVYSLGFGTIEGTRLPDANRPDGLYRDLQGRPVQSALNEDSLRLLAEETDGTYSRGVDAAFLTALRKTLAELDAIEISSKRQKIAQPLYQGPLAASLLFLMLSLVFRQLTRLRFPGVRPAVTAALVLLLQAPFAAGSALSDAQKNLAEEDFETAARLFREAARSESGDRASRLSMAAASAAYRAGIYDQASQSYGRALLSSELPVRHAANFGLASSLFQQGLSEQDLEKRKELWQDSLGRFQTAHDLKPGDQPTNDNIAAVERALAELEKQQQEEQKKEDQKKDKDDQDKNDDQKEDEQEKEKQEDQDQESDGDESSEDQKQGEDGQEKDDQQQKEGDQEGDQGQDGKQDKQEGKGDQQDQQSENEGSGDQEQQKQKGDQEGDKDQQSGEQPEKADQQGEGEDGQEQQGSQSGKEGEQGQQQDGTGQQPPEQEARQPTEEEIKEALAAQAQQQKGETPQAYARRLLRAYADTARRPPPGRRFTPRRPLKDW